MKSLRLAAAVAAFTVLGVASALCAPAQVPATLVIEHVTLVPMTPGGPERPDSTVVIRYGRVVEAGEPSRAKIPSAAVHIDGHGKWLMPGLTDAHVHLENDRLLRLYLRAPNLPDGSVRTEDALLPYVANGVLQVFDLSAMPETFAQRAEVDAGRVLGPHIVSAAMIDGDPPIWPVGMTRVAANPPAGRQAVRDAQREGYDLIKAYSNLDLPTFTAIVAEARARRLNVVGHIPGRGKGLTEKFFQPGYRLVAHAEEFAQQTDLPDEAAIPRYVEIARRNGTWLTATLTLDDRILEETRHPESLKARPELDYLNPLFRAVVMSPHNPYTERANPKQIAYFEKIVVFNRKLVAAFAAAHIPILAGTDSPVPGVAPGFALHDELEALVKAGLTPRQALDGATRLPCAWLGKAGECGVVERGARADLLLLDGDPLADVANTRRISGVIAAGRYTPRAELDRRMAELHRRLTAS